MEHGARSFTKKGTGQRPRKSVRSKNGHGRNGLNQWFPACGTTGFKFRVDNMKPILHIFHVRAGLISRLKESTFEPNTLGVRSVAGRNTSPKLHWLIRPSGLLCPHSSLIPAMGHKLAETCAVLIRGILRLAMRVENLAIVPAMEDKSGSRSNEKANVCPLNEGSGFPFLFSSMGKAPYSLLLGTCFLSSVSGFRFTLLHPSIETL